MKIKHLHGDTNLQTIAVRLPDYIYKASSLPSYRIKNVPVYLQGFVMGDFFVKTDLKSSRVYPMFWSVVPDGIEEWEVVNIMQKQKSIKAN